jgi:hypothetical protein
MCPRKIALYLLQMSILESQLEKVLRKKHVHFFHPYQILIL